MQIMYHKILLLWLDGNKNNWLLRAYTATATCFKTISVDIMLFIIFTILDKYMDNFNF